MLSDVFALQERITRQIVGSLVPEIESEEMRLLERGARRFSEADDLSWRAMKAFLDSIHAGDARTAAEALRLAESAIARDRNCALAWYTLCRVQIGRVFFGWAEERRAALEEAQKAADVLMSLAPNDSRAYLARGGVLGLAGDLGVRRISIGGALARSAWNGFANTAREIAEKGTFNGLAWTGAPLDLNGLFR